MDQIGLLVARLSGADNRQAYAALKSLLSESTKTNAVYPFFDQLVAMLDSENAYRRSRGLLLLSANARWDESRKFDGIIDSYLTHVHDAKPITARQCIQALPEIARRLPHLARRIRSALESADPRIYPDSMEPLIRSDILIALCQLPCLK